MKKLRILLPSLLFTAAASFSPKAPAEAQLP